jgi:hypothetical protein
MISTRYEHGIFQRKGAGPDWHESTSPVGDLCANRRRRTVSLPRNGMMDDARTHLSPLDEGHIHRELPCALQKLLRTVEWIDEPESRPGVPPSDFGLRRLLGKHRKARSEQGEPTDEIAMGAPVRFGEWGMVLLEGDSRVATIPLEDLLSRSLDDLDQIVDPQLGKMFGHGEFANGSHEGVEGEGRMTGSGQSRVPEVAPDGSEGRCERAASRVTSA